MKKKYDVCGIGNAIMDYEIQVKDTLLAQHGVEKGLMTLVDEIQQAKLIEAFGNQVVKKQSGGSGANTINAISQLGGETFYSCKVANDEDGIRFLSDFNDVGIDTNLDQGTLVDGVTGKCLVMISEDAERTMNTYLGTSSDLSILDINGQAIMDSEYLFMEGYLVSTNNGVNAMKAARKIAKEAGTRISLTFSDPAMVKYFGSNMHEIVDGGLDLLFANMEEAQIFTGAESMDGVIHEIKKIARHFVITQGADGSIVFDGENLLEIAPHKVTAVDTTGAGDMFSGAFLYGITNGLDFKKAGMLASLASSKVVTQYGPRLNKRQMQDIKSASQLE